MAEMVCLRVAPRGRYELHACDNSSLFPSPSPLPSFLFLRVILFLRLIYIRFSPLSQIMDIYMFLILNIIHNIFSLTEKCSGLKEVHNYLVYFLEELSFNIKALSAAGCRPDNQARFTREMRA